MVNHLICEPIGYFYGGLSEKYMAARQAKLALDGENGQIVLNPKCNFEQALEDLAGFEHVWILYWFNRNTSWKTKVHTPREGPKRGLFATRSPHRPNPIGLSCVELLAIKGRKIYIGKNDLLDQTPILDIKPYLAYADAFPNSKLGWIAGPPKSDYEVTWSPIAKQQVQYIEAHRGMRFIDGVAIRLKDNPFPFRNHRIKKIKENTYELAYKTWRLRYLMKGNQIEIQVITSGYTQETLEGRQVSLWPDVPFHQKFLDLFSDVISLA